MTDRLSPLHESHRALGAAFTDFAGWQMPVRYASDLAEHHAVRSAAGLFDVSHMAQFRISGPDAAAFLDRALAVDASAIAPARARYTMILAEDGGIVDDLIVYRDRPDAFLVVANAGNRDPVAAALADRRTGFDVEIADETEQTVLLAVQGPRAREVLAATAGLEVGGRLDELPYYAVADGRFGGEPVLVARTGYTGEDGFELYADVAAAPELWEALLAAGAPLGLVPCGLAARDTLRLEAGMPLYGHELARDVRPAQAGLGRVGLPPRKTADFVGRAALERAAARDADAPVLVGLAADGRRAARAGYPVLAGERVVGEVTSGALSPTLGHPIAMAFVERGVSAPGTALDLDVRGTRVPATVVALPFYRRSE